MLTFYRILGLVISVQAFRNCREVTFTYVKAENNFFYVPLDLNVEPNGNSQIEIIRYGLSFVVHFSIAIVQERSEPINGLEQLIYYSLWG